MPHHLRYAREHDGGNDGGGGGVARHKGITGVFVLGRASYDIVQIKAFLQDFDFSRIAGGGCPVGLSITIL